MKKKRSNILIIYTGGTIGMIMDPAKKALKPFDFNQITEEVPELKKIKCNINAVSFKNPVDSSNINTSVWEKIGDYIIKNFNQYDGFVVLHGTDTMSYTASALSFMFENLTKPIIFTGSQLPIGMVRTDGKENLITAIEIAADRKEDKPVVQEVAIYFEYQLYRANRTTKISTEHFDAFKSYNYPILAEAGISINYNFNALKKPEKSTFSYHKGFDSSVSVLHFFPGIDIRHISYVIKNPDIKVFVLLTYGSGNLPINEKLISLIKKQTQKGKIFLNVSQCKAGKVEQGKYETGQQLLEVGVVGVKDMTLESALAKAMFLLEKNKKNRSSFVKEFLTIKAGEFTN